MFRPPRVEGLSWLIGEDLASQKGESKSEAGKTYESVLQANPEDAAGLGKLIALCHRVGLLSDENREKNLSLIVGAKGQSIVIADMMETIIGTKIFKGPQAQANFELLVHAIKNLEQAYKGMTAEEKGNAMSIIPIFYRYDDLLQGFGQMLQTFSKKLSDIDLNASDDEGGDESGDEKGDESDDEGPTREAKFEVDSKEEQEHEEKEKAPSGEIPFNTDEGQKVYELIFQQPMNGMFVASGYLSLMMQSQEDEQAEAILNQIMQSPHIRELLMAYGYLRSRPSGFAPDEDLKDMQLLLQNPKLLQSTSLAEGYARLKDLSQPFEQREKFFVLLVDHAAFARELSVGIHLVFNKFGNKLDPKQEKLLADHAPVAGPLAEVVVLLLKTQPTLAIKGDEKSREDRCFSLMEELAPYAPQLMDRIERLAAPITQPQFDRVVDLIFKMRDEDFRNAVNSIKQARRGEAKGANKILGKFSTDLALHILSFLGPRTAQGQLEYKGKAGKDISDYQSKKPFKP